MTKRLGLHDILVATLGSPNVYFQPPSTVNMDYPCIVYSRSRIDEKRADNKMYSYTKAYTVTVIDPNPDSSIPDKVLALPLCSFDRHFTANNLNHDAFNIYY